MYTYHPGTDILYLLVFWVWWPCFDRR